MKISIKKYWWVTLAIFVLPIALNFVLLIPSFIAIVGDEIAWLSFWGGYLGAIVSTVAAFIILYIQRKDNESENEKNRNTNKLQNDLNRLENERLNRANRQQQLNIMKYHQQSSWLDNFRDASLEYCRALNSNDFILISNMMWLYPHDAFNIVKGIFDNIDKAQNKFAFVRKQDEESSDLAKYINERVLIYRNALNDLQWIVLYYKSTVHELRCKKTFIEYLQFYENKNANINNILQISRSQVEYTAGCNNSKYFNDIFLSIFTGLEKNSIEVQGKIYEYIKQEQDNINKLLTENIE